MATDLKKVMGVLEGLLETQCQPGLLETQCELGLLEMIDNAEK